MEAYMAITIPVVLVHRCCHSGTREFISVIRHLKGMGVEAVPRTVRTGSDPEGARALGVSKEDVRARGPHICLPSLQLTLLSTDIRDREAEMLAMIDRALEAHANG